MVRSISLTFVLFAALTVTPPRMAHADTKAGEDKSRLCDICHNNGSHDEGQAPLLEGQPRQYLFIQLKAFKDKRRVTGGMDINTSGMTDEDMRDISEYFAAQEVPQTSFKPDSTKVALGRQTADDLKCGSCHGSSYKGHDEVPRLAGQWSTYILAELKNFRTGRRSHGDAEATDAMRNPGAQDATNLAHYFAQLK